MNLNLIILSVLKYFIFNIRKRIKWNEYVRKTDGNLRATEIAYKIKIAIYFNQQWFDLYACGYGTISDLISPFGKNWTGG